MSNEFFSFSDFFSWVMNNIENYNKWDEKIYNFDFKKEV